MRRRRRQRQNDGLPLGPASFQRHRRISHTQWRDRAGHCDPTSEDRPPTLSKHTRSIRHHRGREPLLPMVQGWRRHFRCYQRLFPQGQRFCGRQWQLHGHRLQWYYHPNKYHYCGFPRLSGCHHLSTQGVDLCRSWLSVRLKRHRHRRRRFGLSMVQGSRRHS